MIDLIARFLKQAIFLVLCLTLLIAPWLFGAWEMWWFWPLTTLLFLASLLWGLKLLLESLSANKTLTEDTSSVRNSRRLFLMWMPFLAYAFVRFLQADVRMEAERSFLLFATGTLVAAMVVFALDSWKRRQLWDLLFANLVLLGAYGLINHVVCGSKLVLWEPGYPQYVNESRATGTYFCPDHFAGIMELLLCMSLGVLMARDMRTWRRRLAYAASAIALAGIVLSKSRGAGLTVVTIVAAAMVWGFAQWPKVVRWYARGAMASAALALLALAMVFGSGYTERFARYFTKGQDRSMSITERKDVLLESLKHTCRGKMYAASWEAWRERPWLGIGPGAHQHWWPRIAASNDGDRSANRWPTLLNTDMFSYEVHNDWLQLLEEYGLVGFSLFVLAFAGMGSYVLGGVRRESASCLESHWVYPSGRRYEHLLAGSLILVAMSVHSLGDFNLQMPATTWMLAVVVGIAIRHDVHRATDE